MKKLTMTVLFALASTQAMAGSWETRCETKSVPYQETVKGGNAGEVIGGAVIGGVIGKVVTGKKGGAAVGAVIGGAVANEASRRTVTKYKDVETCSKVYIPSEIYDRVMLRETIQRLNGGERLNRELVKDVQYTIGVHADGVWGPQSVRAANAYLAGDTPATPVTPPATGDGSALYSLIVNNVVVINSYDLGAIDEIKQGLLRAGVTASIEVDTQ
ncbi:hypothetical protein E7681_11060 [Thalassobius vesicularis]|uniref:17 kDa surface antigen n=1 Tax=Thalassobius vesicularis TaxID=1294297 RepID=A0A4S3M8P5_9RHOB|nr:hypothetical protein [Thalassobius vesicularis]THD73235.1 hypothetical protein E7681_11060 [Thalassobius vesicularis]